MTPHLSHVCLVTQSCPSLCDPMDCSQPGSYVHGDSPGKNTRVGCHALLQGNLPNPGIEPRSPALQADSLPSEPPGKPQNTGVGKLSLLQGIFPTQESNLYLLHSSQILYQWSYQGSPYLINKSNFSVWQNRSKPRPYVVHIHDIHLPSPLCGHIFECFMENSKKRLIPHLWTHTKWITGNPWLSQALDRSDDFWQWICKWTTPSALIAFILRGCCLSIRESRQYRTLVTILCRIIVNMSVCVCVCVDSSSSHFFLLVQDLI